MLIKCLRTQKGLYHAEANPGGRSRYSAYFKLSNRHSLKSVMNIKRGELIVVTVIKIDTKKQGKVAKLAKRKRY